jgi:hypothetical protein
VRTDGTASERVHAEPPDDASESSVAILPLSPAADNL